MPLKESIAQEFVVLHTAVEGFFRGQVITLEHLKRGLEREIDLDRLLQLRAIAPVDSEAARAVQAELPADAITPAGDLVSAPVPLPPPDATAKAAKAEASS